MRWIRLNCILLASIAILSSTKAESSRHKRDLSLVKNFLRTAIFGREIKTDSPLVNRGENYKIFRIPGFNNVLVKAVPKVAGAIAVPEAPVSSEDAKVSVVESYLGTKTQGETLNALQRVKTLLGSGLLTASKDQVIPVGPLPPHLQLIAIGEGTFEKPHILLDTSSICDDVQADETPVVVQKSTIWQDHPFISIFQRQLSFPTIVKPITPVNVPVPTIPTKYSYKQFHGDGKVTTYTANDDQNVMVTQFDQSGPLPPVVTYRLREVMKLGAHGLQGLAAIPVLAGNIQRPIQYFTSPKINPYRPVMSPAGNNYSYKQIHKDGSVTSYSSGHNSGDVVVMEGGKVPPIPAFITDRIEKVAATAATGKQPNPAILSGLNVAQAHWYNPLAYGHQSVNTKGGMQVNVGTTEQKQTYQKLPVNTGSQGMYSYQTIHKDGSVTNYGVGRSVPSKPINTEMKPVTPVFIEDRLQPIAKTNDGSFSYKIIHNDGSVTDYGVFGVHEGSKGGGKIVPVQNTKQETYRQYDFLSENKGPVSQSDIKEKVASGYTYKTIHSDGSVTSYSSNGVVEENRNGSSIYYQNGVEEINKQQQYTDQNKRQKSVSALGTSEEDKQTVQENTHTNTGLAFNNQYLKQNGQVSNQNNVPGIFSYKIIHKDGSSTNYPQNSVKEEYVPFKNESPQSLNTAVVNQQRNNQKVHVHAQNIVVPVSGSFSYKSVHNDGSMTTYTQSGVKEETNEKESYPVHMASQSVNNVKVNMNEQPLDIKHNKGTSPTSSFSYKAVHSDGSETNYSGKGVEETKAPSRKNPVNASNQQYSSNKNDDAIEEVNVHTNPQHNGKTSGSFSYKTIYSDGSVRKTQSGSLSHNVQNQDQPSAAFDESKSNNDQMSNQVIPPAPKLPQLSSNDLSVTPISVLVADSNKVLFTKPVVSSYTYKQINHNSPDQFTVAVNIDDVALKESAQVAVDADMNEATTVETIPKDYVYIPPENVNEPLPIKPLVPKAESNKTTQNPPSVVVMAPVDVVPCVEKSLSEHPIVVLDEPMKYSYQQRKVDGSAIHVESDQNVVSVNISPNERVRYRGDIPESP